MRNESQDSDVVSLYPLMQGYKRLSTQALARKAVHDQKHILNVSVDQLLANDRIKSILDTDYFKEEAARDNLRSSGNDISLPPTNYEPIIEKGNRR